MLYTETCRDATAVVAAVTGCFLRAGEEVLVTAERGQVPDPLEKGDPNGGCRILVSDLLSTCGRGPTLEATQGQILSQPPTDATSGR